MGYKKKAGYFIELCERPYKLAIKNNNPKEELVEFNTNHNILKEALFAEENFLNTLSNLFLVNINCLSEFEWLLHDKCLNSTYSTKSAVKIEAKPLEERTKKQQYTKIMLHAIEDENEIEKALDYCKKITSFIHCPIQLNDYKRMDAYKENKELLNQVYKTTKELKQPIGNNTITTNNNSYDQFRKHTSRFYCRNFKRS